LDASISRYVQSRPPAAAYLGLLNTKRRLTMTDVNEQNERCKEACTCTDCKCGDDCRCDK
jgi:hypothetical protein